MIDRSTVQELQNIVASMGRDNVCQQPHAFAGAILDMCEPGEVKLLTTALRSHYGLKLMSFFLDGNGDATTWTQQKTFLIDESGMSVENAENVLEALWQAMGWQRPKPSRPNPEPVKHVVSPKDYISQSQANASAATAPPKVDPKYQKEYINPRPSGAASGQSQQSAAQKKSASDAGKDRTASGSAGSAPVNDSKSNPSPPQPKPEPMLEEPRSKGIPLLIALAWAFLNYQLSDLSGAGNLIARIQEGVRNGEYQLLAMTLAPIISALVVCPKGSPKLLRGLGSVVLGFAAMYCFVMCFYMLDLYVLKLNLLFQSDSNVGTIATVAIIFISIGVGVGGGKACYNVVK